MIDKEFNLLIGTEVDKQQTIEKKKSLRMYVCINIERESAPSLNSDFSECFYRFYLFHPAVRAATGKFVLLKYHDELRLKNTKEYEISCTIYSQILKSPGYKFSPRARSCAAKNR